MKGTFSSEHQIHQIQGQFLLHCLQNGAKPPLTNQAITVDTHCELHIIRMDIIQTCLKCVYMIRMSNVNMCQTIFKLTDKPIPLGFILKGQRYKLYLTVHEKCFSKFYSSVQHTTVTNHVFRYIVTSYHGNTNNLSVVP